MIKNVSIPTPCHQQWNNMTAASDGRHCSSCAKTVIDFSKMSDQQVIAYLSTNNQVCGRFDERQITAVNYAISVEDTAANGFWKRMLLAVTMFVSLQYAKAQTAALKPAVEQTAKTNVTLGEVVAVNDTVRPVLVTGIITAAEDASPLPGVSIIIKGANTGTVTDVQGKFRLTVPALGRVLVVSYVGYRSQEIVIDPNNNQPVALRLKMNAAIMGDVVIIRAPFFKRMYYRFIKRPIRKIFG